jgi:hypothetical protein
MIEILLDRHTYTVIKEGDTVSIVCKVCEMRSYNANDVKHGYCGNCKELHASLEYKAVQGIIDFAPTSEEPLEPGTKIPSTLKEKEAAEKARKQKEEQQERADAYKAMLMAQRQQILEEKKMAEQRAQQQHDQGVKAIMNKYPWLNGE